MNIDFLTLSQWMSPAFPVGAFAYSHGLETAIQDGRINDARQLQNWLVDVLVHGSVRADLVLMSAAFNASDVAGIDEVARAFQPSKERLRETERMGAAFARTVRDVWELDVPDCLYPVAVGRAAGQKRLGFEQVAGLYAHAFAANLVSAAIRLVPLGQTEGQGVLQALTPHCAELAKATMGATLDDLASSAFMSDIAAMRHEVLEPRVFQS